MRYFYTYVDASDKQVNSFRGQVKRKHAYELESDSASDPDKTDYWTYLFPNQNTWQWILDTKVIAGLSEAGDSLAASREIDHWVEFDSRANLKKFTRLRIKMEN